MYYVYVVIFSFVTVHCELISGYDRFIKLWDTETGDCISRFTNRKVAYCVKFHPEPSKQNLFVAGTSDKKIVCVSGNGKMEMSIMHNILTYNELDQSLPACLPACVPESSIL